MNGTDFKDDNPGAEKLVVLQNAGWRRCGDVLTTAIYGAPKYLSPSAMDRAAVEAWMDWSIDVLEQAFIGVFRGFYRTPEQKRDWKAWPSRRRFFNFPRVTASIFESNELLIVGKDVFFTNDATIKISREVLKRRQATAGVTAVNNPLFRQIERQRESCLSK